MSAGQNPITVLNVDDYEPGRYSRSRVLRAAGFVVLEASSGSEALGLVRATRPHLVVLDVHLPDMSGVEVCRQIKSDPDLGQTLVLHLSATSVSTENKVRGFAAGADGYLAEPVDAEELIANVHALLRLKRTEEELRQTNVTLQAIVSSSPLGIVAIGPDGRVRRWNVAAEHMFGWAEHEVVGGPLSMFPAQDEAALLAPLDGVTPGPTTGFEARPVRRDGSVLDVSISLAPLRRQDGGIDGVLALVEDIGERKRTEREVARLYLEAQEANRTKDEFLATLSHELRTPLNAMLGWVRLLRSGGVPAGREAHALEVVERNTLTQVRLIEDILDVSRIVSGKLRLRSEPVDLAHVVESAADAIRPAAKLARIALDVAIDDRPGESLTTVGDPQRLQQVVSNLLSNAVKFTPAGGRVELTLRQVGGGAEIVVRDTGAGIDASLLPFVFERFRQGDSSMARAHGGLGLGLSIVRHLVQAHAGRIAVSSEGTGRGSTFTVTLPMVPITLGEGLSEGGEPVGVSLDQLRVLIVEDDADSRSLMEAVLTGRGAHVRSARSADEAIQLLERSQVDVLVADIGLPHADGFTLLRRVRSLPRLAQLPAVAVTGFTSEEDRLRVTAAGYAAHLPKPFDPETLARTIARAAQRG